MRDHCKNCKGRGFMRSGYACLDCGGTGRLGFKSVKYFSPELLKDNPEGSGLKSAMDAYHMAEWEREDRREEARKDPELNAAIEAVKRMFEDEAAVEEATDTTQNDQRVLADD